MGDSLVAAIDIGGTKIAVAAVDPNGHVVARTRFLTTTNEVGPDATIARIGDAIQWCEREAHQRIEAIGIGCTGPVDPLTGVIGAVDLLPGWEGTPLVPILATRFQVPAAMENDADAGALGEWQLYRDGRFLFVSIGTGIGAGLILNGEIYRGVDGSHPELGHHTIDATGPDCYCGASGCWESLASGPAVARLYGDEALGAEQIFALARQGNPTAQHAVDRQAYYLGLGVANLMTLFCPGRIVLGGGIMQCEDLLMDGIQAVIRRHCGLVPASRIHIAVSKLGPDAVLIGAAHIAEKAKQKLEVLCRNQ